MVKMRIKFLGRRGFNSNSSVEHSISGIKSVFSRREFDNVVPSSNTWWSGRSYAASVASDMPYREKDGKRVPVEARRAMIESFVDKYKASNAGKLPSISQTQRQLGGSFYVVKKILQDLQNESTMASLKSRSKMLSQETATKENPNVIGKHMEVASDPQNSFCTEKILSADDGVELGTLVSHSVLPMKSNFLEDSKEVISASHKKPYGDDKKNLGGTSGDVYTENHVLNNERDLFSDVHLKSTFSSEELKHEDPNCEEQQVHCSLELDRKNIKNRTMDVAELQTCESKPWGGRIKSIVDVVINIWRKF